MARPPLTARWDVLAARTDGIDRWCSASTWQCAVDDAFGDEDDGATNSYVVAEGEGWAGAMRSHHIGDGRVALVPLDAVWGFASPFVSDLHDVALQVAAMEFADTLRRDRTWRVAFVTGIVADSPLDQAMLEALLPGMQLFAGEPTIRCIASLADGIDGFLSRRSRAFRRNLRQAERRNTDLTWEIADALPVDAIFERLHGVERCSWKGQADSGIESPRMDRLYRMVATELQSGGSLRVAFARLDGRDVGFILGGVAEQHYRGLQISFVEDVRARSIGSLLQWHEVQRLCDERVELYDLGMDMEYKRAWAESQFVTRPIIATR